MPAYPSEDSLREAVQRLQDSRADPRLVDFLIVKRAMTLSNATRIELSTVDEHFSRAVHEFVSWSSGEVPIAEWFNPFGTGRTVEMGFRTEKYLSNGTAVTVPRWNDIVLIVGRNRARVIEFREGYEGRLADFLLGRAPAPGRAGPQKPRLTDAAIWFFRSTDLEAELDGDLSETALIDAFMTAVGLTKLESESLFDQPAPVTEQLEGGVGA